MHHHFQNGQAAFSAIFGQDASAEGDRAILTRAPSVKELDEFINRCMEEKDWSAQELYQYFAHMQAGQHIDSIPSITCLYQELLAPYIVQRIRMRFSS